MKVATAQQLDYDDIESQDMCYLTDVEGSLDTYKLYVTPRGGG
jgi:hypothetical protein